MRWPELAAEQPLPGEAGRYALRSFHYSTDTAGPHPDSLLQQGDKTPTRADALAFGFSLVVIIPPTHGPNN